MRSENKWEYAVREKLAGMEKELPREDWSDFLAKSKVREKGAGKVLAIVFGCCAAAAIIASVLILPRHSMNPEPKRPVLLAESVDPQKEIPESPVNSESVKPMVQPKRNVNEQIPKSKDVAPISETTGADMDETIKDPDEETGTDTAERPFGGGSMPKENDSRHEYDHNEYSPENGMEPSRKRAHKHSVTVGISGIVSSGSRGGSVTLDAAPPWSDNNAGTGSYEYTHKRPVSFGLSVSYNLTPWMSIVSGVEYSRYKSSVHYYGDGMTIRQHADYIGIPARIDWRILRTRGLSAYAGAGFKADWCVKASYAGEKLTDKGLNWTTYATVGAQYEILRGISVYFEPELSYYLNSGDHKIQTYRTENPLMVSAVLGLRLTLGNER